MLIPYAPYSLYYTPHSLYTPFPPVLIDPPETAPVTVAEVKAQLRITGAEDDALIQAMIDAATAYLDGWSGVLGRCLVDQTWRQDYTGFWDRLSLPFAPVSSITSVTYVDVDGADQTLDETAYELLVDHLSPYVARLPDQTWPDVYGTAMPAAVTFVAGYGDAADVPAPLRQAIILMAQKLHAGARSDPGLSRETVEGVGSREWRGGEMLLAAHDRTVEALIAPYRRIGF
jgi:uncharacterized phiE125 gp8 family phage protein